MDHDSARIARGQAALGSEAALTVEDVRHTALPKAQVIVCLDLLHYMPPEHQDALLQRCAAALEPGGLLLIRDGHSGAGFRSWVTEWSERLSTAIGRHKGDGVYFRPSEEIAEFLRANGLSVELLPCSSGTPFSNALWIARREE
jgi:2-polyprenyl-3-methyl-5-hydroxy-6-metoxy-1,4-benzoquinol methylase